MSNPSSDVKSAKTELLNPEGPSNHESMPWTEVDYARMDMLEGFDLADCVIQATIRGQERLVRELMARRGPVPIVLEADPRIPGTYELNGRSFGFSISESTFAANIKSPAALKSLLAMIEEFGMKGLIEPDKSFPFLLKKVERNSILMRYNVSRFEGTLPELVDGVLGQPELAIALDYESSRTSTPNAYQPMLCWASEEMVLQFRKNLAPLIHYQDVEGHGSLAQWKESSGQPGNMDFANIIVGVAPSKACSEAFEYLNHTMTPMSSKLGFRDQRGRLLCETTAEFLLQFPARDCDEDNLKTAFDFTANYCPIDIMALQAKETCREKYGVEEFSYSLRVDPRTKMKTDFDLLFKALNRDHPLQGRVKDLMTKEQWVGLLGKASKVESASMLGLFQAFGIDNTGKSGSVFPHDLEILARGGFRYSSQAKVFEDPNKYDKHNKTKDLALEPSLHLPFSTKSISPATGEISMIKALYRDCAAVNLWAAPGAAPVDVAHALKMSARVSFEVLSTAKILALHSYLVNAGVESCAKAATAPSHWLTMAAVFSSDELQPYLKEMPAKARGRVLEAGMGL